MDFSSKPPARVHQKNRLASLANRSAKDQIILSNLLKIISSGKNIALYYADIYEVKIFPDQTIWNQYSGRKYFPRVDGQTLQFIEAESFKIGAFQMIEPVGINRIEASDCDWIVIPSLGFNSSGFRLGRGKGFYDRYLEGISVDKLIGLSYSECFPINFPEDPHDVRIGTLITEESIHKFI